MDNLEQLQGLSERDRCCPPLLDCQHLLFDLGQMRRILVIIVDQDVIVVGVWKSLEEGSALALRLTR